ncbi:transposase [Desulfitobacterium chlororespirans]|uniref:REP element-mobilizing transposase RayT n=1 Tax=Desulfitobacterium chlororespirans DSM 11544 TaxID=1121395 RepID=A0A1M7UA17_9FIRM|nr:transposase [Desulfitobacterium chlororespirans]SHN79776.1 REP element-mobilizing transposase RayT [Desulfitobacterium chlororespirans DSM 11544]
MPRRPRKQSSTGIYHVIMRGINRQNIFDDKEDRRKFIEKLVYYKTVCGYKIYAYCLMDNHIHVLIQELNEPLSISIKRISSSYVMWFNKKYERCGHLFQERFRSEVVETDRYFLTVLRYIHQNPVRAKIVEDVAKYPWSSYHEFFLTDSKVDREYVLKIFGDISADALINFSEFHKDKNDDSCLDAETLRLISDETIKEMIRVQFGTDSVRLIEMEKTLQSKILRALKSMDGVSVRQISRVTGLSKSKVWRA